MAFTQMEFDPADGLANETSYPATPESEAEARAQIQTPLNQLREALNGLMAELENAVTESSGAENIGSAAIAGVSGLTLYDQLADLKTQIDAVVSGGLTDNIIENNHLSDDCVTGAEIANDSIDSEHYAAGSIDLEHLAADSVDGTKIADDSIDSEHYVDGSIDAEHLATGAVTETKIGTGAVTTTKLGTIQTITLDTDDTLTYDTANNRLVLNVSGCAPVQLCPVIFGTSASPPAGTYPKGTIYLTYQA